jgi:GT2 family glycosyltransferase
MQHEPLVSIIVVNFNGAEFLRKCILSVLTSLGEFELVVVDNASTDDSMAVLGSFSDERIRVIRNRANLGFAEGNNVGSKIASGEFLLFLNNDTRVDPSWLIPLLKTMEGDADVAIVQSKLVSLKDNGKTIDSRGDFVDTYGSMFCRDQGLLNSPETDKDEEVFSARGAAMMIRRDVFFEVGMFDPDFFMGYEDADLSWRVRLSGWKVMCVPSSVVYHEGGGTFSAVRAYQNSKNFFILQFKNQTTRTLAVHVPPVILVSLIGLLSNTLSNRDVQTMYTLRAYKWLFSNLPLICAKRAFVQTLRRATATDSGMMLRPTLRQYIRYNIDLHESWSDMEKLKLVHQAYLRSLIKTLQKGLSGHVK